MKTMSWTDWMITNHFKPKIRFKTKNDGNIYGGGQILTLMTIQLNAEKPLDSWVYFGYQNGGARARAWWILEHTDVIMEES